MEIYTLCIPRVLKDISCSKLRRLLVSSQLGNILSINEYNCNDDLYKKVVFTLGFNEKAENSHLVSKCINNDENIKLVYNYPWFWRIYINPQNNQSSSNIKAKY
jgi:hypothetical protein